MHKRAPSRKKRQRGGRPKSVGWDPIPTVLVIPHLRRRVYTHARKLPREFPATPLPRLLIRTYRTSFDHLGDNFSQHCSRMGWCMVSLKIGSRSSAAVYGSRCTSGVFCLGLYLSEISRRWPFLLSRSYLSINQH